MSLIFGPAGHSDSYRGKTADIAPWLALRGLGAYEVQFGRGVSMGESTARAIGASMSASRVAVSVHAPYYISLSNLSLLDKNIDYLRRCCEAAGWLGASRIVVHTGGSAGKDRAAALGDATAALCHMLDTARAEQWPETFFCLETMGKKGQLGTLDEVLCLCSLDERFLPCIDFGHLYARSLGAVDGDSAMAGVLDSVENALGLSRARRIHIHFSHIEFGPSGEKRHRTFADTGGFGPDWRPLAAHLASRAYEGVVICESAGTQAEDSAEMRAVFEEFVRGA